MSTIRRFANCKISIYANNHIPPHFHIEGRGFRIIIEIDTLTIRVENKRDVVKVAEAMEWASLNIERLKAEWARINLRN